MNTATLSLWEQFCWLKTYSTKEIATSEFYEKVAELKVDVVSDCNLLYDKGGNFVGFYSNWTYRGGSKNGEHYGVTVTTLHEDGHPYKKIQYAWLTQH